MTNQVDPPTYGAVELQTLTDPDQLTPGERFEVIWAFRNTTDSAWTDDFALVYTDESDLGQIGATQVNMAGQDRLPLSSLGPELPIGPGETVYLTLQLMAPDATGAYLSGWQMEDGDRNRIGPLAELRINVKEPAEKGVDDLTYSFISYTNSAANQNSLKSGQKFSGTWTLQNTSFSAWEGDYRVTYVPMGQSVNGLSDAMGVAAGQSLWDVTGRARIEPGDVFEVSLNFTAPQQANLYAFHWQIVDPNGVPFGGTRWMAVVVAEETGVAPQPPSLPGGGAGYVYRGPAVSFYTGIHGPASDHSWNLPGFKDMMQRLNMPIFFMSQGINPDFGHMGDPSRNVVRLVWNPRPVSADAAYEELASDQLKRWWDRGYRKFVFFNEPQLKEVNGISKEGLGIAWFSAEEFAAFLRTCLLRARQDFPGIFLYATPMTTNAAFDPWRWYSAMWSQVSDLVQGWCMHAYSGNNGNAEAAAKELADQIIEVQRRMGLQVPIIVGEASVNRGGDAAQKARVARLVHERLKNVPGVEGVYWFAADWASDQDANNEGWFKKGIASAYLGTPV